MVIAMNAFAAGIDILFNDVNLGEDAVYTPIDGGGGGTVRVIKNAPDQALEFNSGQFISDSFFVDVRVSEITEPKRGDTFALQDSGETVIVISDPRRDPQRLVWKVEVREV